MVGGQPAAPQPGGYYIPVITNLGPPGPPGGGGGGGGVGGGGGGSGGYPFPVDTVPVEIKPGGEINTMVPPNNAPAPGPALQPVHIFPPFISARRNLSETQLSYSQNDSSLMQYGWLAGKYITNHNSLHRPFL